VRRPIVVELAGPAGAGKSTVWRVLTTRARLVHASVWDLPRPLLVASALRMLPAMTAVVRRSRALPWEHLKQMVRLDALRSYLHRLRSAQHDLILMDEGAVLGMSWLRVLGPACFRDGRMDGWWHRTLDAWAPLLDGIVLLDAPDAVLVHRIRTRAQRHPFKNRPESEINQFSASYREAFTWVIAGLTARGGAQVVTMESNGAGPTDIAERVLTAFEGTVHAR